jgi:hypothetical protein
LVKLEELVSSPVLEVQERASSALQVVVCCQLAEISAANPKGAE